MIWLGKWQMLINLLVESPIGIEKERKHHLWKKLQAESHLFLRRLVAWTWGREIHMAKVYVRNPKHREPIHPPKEDSNGS